MSESILTSTKKVLGIADDYTEFDQDIILFINGAFDTLNQLGLGPVDGFTITDKEATWESYDQGNKNLSSVRTYVFLRVRLIFDPPATSFAIDAMKTQISELEWRLNVTREESVRVLDDRGLAVH